MLWIKAFHVVFMVTWFAGLLYLPRLFVYHAVTEDNAGYERFCVMERKLLIIMSIGAVLTATFGLWLLALRPALLGSGWMQAKLALVAALVVYHLWCARLAVGFRRRANRHGHRWYRYFNEAPALLLIGIVVLAVVKPF